MKILVKIRGREYDPLKKWKLKNIPTQMLFSRQLAVIHFKPYFNPKENLETTTCVHKAWARLHAYRADGYYLCAYTNDRNKQVMKWIDKNNIDLIT